MSDSDNNRDSIASMIAKTSDLSLNSKGAVADKADSKVKKGKYCTATNFIYFLFRFCLMRTFSF